MTSMALFSVRSPLSQFHRHSILYPRRRMHFGIATVTPHVSKGRRAAQPTAEWTPPRRQAFTITVNAPPTVNIVTQPTNAVFLAGDDITRCGRCARSGRNGGPGSSCFHQAPTCIANLDETRRLHSLCVTDAAPGQYQFSARATDNLGSTGISSPVNVTVIDRPPILRLGPIAPQSPDRPV